MATRWRDGAWAVVFSASALGVVLPGPAMGQGMPADANGFKLGDGRLHPYFQLDTRVVTNPTYQQDSGASDLVLVARPGLDLILPSNTLDFKLNGDVEWRQFLGVGSVDTSHLSTLMGQAGIDATINKESAVVIRLREKLVRSTDSGSQSVPGRLLRISNDVGLGLDIRPGGGALIFSPDYSFVYERYDRDQGADSGTYDISDLDNMRHVPKLRASWKFLPKTAVFLEAEGHLARYTAGPNVDANILLVQLGAAGSITQRIALLLKVGYGNSFLSDPDATDFSSVIGQAEFNYLFSETMRFRAGALRTVQPTTLFKYFDMIRGYIGYTQAFGGRLQLDLNLAYNYLDFAAPVLGPTGNRIDSNVTGDVTLSYQVLEWLTVSACNRLDLRDSSYTNQMGTQDSYFTNDVYLRASARY
jgi:hypothetical protein